MAIKLVSFISVFTNGGGGGGGGRGGGVGRRGLLVGRVRAGRGLETNIGRGVVGRAGPRGGGVGLNSAPGAGARNAGALRRAGEAPARARAGAANIRAAAGRRATR